MTTNTTRTATGAEGTGSTDPEAWRKEVEARQRATFAKMFANRTPTPATADFDLPAPNDTIAADFSGHTQPDRPIHSRCAGDCRRCDEIEAMLRKPATEQPSPATGGEPAMRLALAALDVATTHLPEDRQAVLRAQAALRAALAATGAELDVEAERREFEAEWRLLNRPVIYDYGTDAHGDYDDAAMFRAWRMWQARAARATAESAPASAAPREQKLLSREPVEAMVHAAQDLPAPRMFGAVWRAMWDAAPFNSPVGAKEQDK